MRRPRNSYGALITACSAGILICGALLSPAAASSQPYGAPNHMQSGVPLVTLSGNNRTFTVAYEARNHDGSVTAMWRHNKWAVLYLGPAGARVSISAAGNPSNGGYIRATASNPQASSTALSSIRSDVVNAGLPSSSAQQISRFYHKVTAASSNAPIVTSWCVDTVYGNNKVIIGNACDVRYKLQEQTGNNYIADDMQGTDSSNPPVGIAAEKTSFNVHMDYTFSADNQVVHLQPVNPQTTGCSPGPTVSFTWFGVGLSWQQTTCGGTMQPKGLSQSINAGGYWTGGTQQPIAVEEILQDHSTTHINPDSTLYLFQTWASGGGDGGHCGNGGGC